MSRRIEKRPDALHKKVRGEKLGLANRARPDPGPAPALRLRKRHALEAVSGKFLRRGPNPGGFVPRLEI